MLPDRNNRYSCTGIRKGKRWASEGKVLRMGLSHAEFMQMFDEWAPSYDATVFRSIPADGFEAYDLVLERVAVLAQAGPGVAVLDVGTGTGNLAALLRERGARVTAVEPSGEMRKVAGQKLGDEVLVLDGQFLRIPMSDGAVDAVVSTYAFHHLTDADKVRGAREMLRVLRSGGRLVLGDIAWANEEARQAMLRRFEAEGKLDLVQEIEEEYYPTVGVLSSIFASLGCTVYLEQLTDWVWAVVARKRG